MRSGPVDGRRLRIRRVQFVFAYVAEERADRGGTPGEAMTWTQIATVQEASLCHIAFMSPFLSDESAGDDNAETQ